MSGELGLRLSGDNAADLYIKEILHSVSNTPITRTKSKTGRGGV